MEVIITRQFAKDVEKELNKNYQVKLAVIIGQLQSAPNLQDIAQVKKLQGYKAAYRIKMDDYRIGFVLQEQKILLSRILNRKEIYRYFP